VCVCLRVLVCGGILIQQTQDTPQYARTTDTQHTHTHTHTPTHTDKHTDTQARVRVRFFAAGHPPTRTRQCRVFVLKKLAP
jgi:hypothetical protein